VVYTAGSREGVSLVSPLPVSNGYEVIAPTGGRNRRRGQRGGDGSTVMVPVKVSLPLSQAGGGGSKVGVVLPSGAAKVVAQEAKRGVQEAKGGASAPKAKVTAHEAKVVAREAKGVEVAREAKAEVLKEDGKVFHDVTCDVKRDVSVPSAHLVGPIPSSEGVSAGQCDMLRVSSDISKVIPKVGVPGGGVRDFNVASAVLGSTTSVASERSGLGEPSGSHMHAHSIDSENKLFEKIFDGSDGFLGSEVGKFLSLLEERKVEAPGVPDPNVGSLLDFFSVGGVGSQDAAVLPAENDEKFYGKNLSVTRAKSSEGSCKDFTSFSGRKDDEDPPSAGSSSGAGSSCHSDGIFSGPVVLSRNGGSGLGSGVSGGEGLAVVSDVFGSAASSLGRGGGVSAPMALSQDGGGGGGGGGLGRYAGSFQKGGARFPRLCLLGKIWGVMFRFWQGQHQFPRSGGRF
jgi:hypothetical protein